MHISYLKKSRKIKKIISGLLTLVIYLFSLSAMAQEAITTTGGDASGSGGSVSYTAGQIAYITISGTNGNTLAQGVQQPYEISVITGIKQSCINLEISAYPNPTSEFLYLKIELKEFGFLRYQLFNVNGQLLETKKIVDDQTVIKMANLTSGIYFLKVIEETINNTSQKDIKTFRIIKK